MSQRYADSHQPIVGLPTVKCYLMHNIIIFSWVGNYLIDTNFSHIWHTEEVHITVDDVYEGLKWINFIWFTRLIGFWQVLIIQVEQQY